MSLTNIDVDGGLRGDYPEVEERSGKVLWLPDRSAEYVPNHELFAVPERHMTYDVPLGLINTAHQVRPEEDFGSMAELKASIEVLGVEQPIRVARWPLETAQAFVELNNAAYPEREPKKPDELTQLPDGSCLVVVYGHRRLAGAALAELETIPTKISENPTFREVVQTQTAENLHYRPAPVAFARGLNQTYRLGIAAGVYKTKADFARQSGLSVSQACDSLRFCELPHSIQALVVDRKVSYATAVQLSRLIPAIQYNETLQMRNRQEYELDQEVAAGRLTEKEKKTLMRAVAVDPDYLSLRMAQKLGDELMTILTARMSAKKAAKYIGGRISELKGEATLALLDEDARRKYELETHFNRARSSTHAAAAALQSIDVAVTLYGHVPEVIAGVVNEGPIQGILGRTAISLGNLGNVSRSETTQQLAFDALEAVAGIAEVDAFQAEEPSLFG